MSANCPSRSISFYEVSAIAREAFGLLNNDLRNNGRTLRRFLARNLICVGSPDELFFSQVFAYEDGYSAEQLQALSVYAEDANLSNLEHFPEGLKYEFTGVKDDSYGIVSNNYRVPGNIKTASVATLRDWVKIVYVLNEKLQEFTASINMVALVSCPDYQYRGLPCSAAPWAIGGSDRNRSSGILEWCVDEADAADRLALMQKHPARFTHLSISSPESMQHHAVHA